jgi:hypothetical protein
LAFSLNSFAVCPTEVEQINVKNIKYFDSSVTMIEQLQKKKNKDL